MDTSNTTPIDQTSSGDLPSVNNPSAYQTVLDRPPSSAILTITYERFCNLTPLEREAALINNNVLVTGRPSRPSRLFEWSWDVPTQNVDPVLDEQVMPLRDNHENDENNSVFPFPGLCEGISLDIPNRRVETGEDFLQRLLGQDTADEERPSWFHVASPGVLSHSDSCSHGTLSLLLPLCGEQTVQVGTPRPEFKGSPGDGNLSPSIRLDNGGTYDRYLWEEIRLDETKAFFLNSNTVHTRRAETPSLVYGRHFLYPFELDDDHRTVGPSPSPSPAQSDTSCSTTGVRTQPEDWPSHPSESESTTYPPWAQLAALRIGASGNEDSTAPVTSMEVGPTDNNTASAVRRE